MNISDIFEEASADKSLLHLDVAGIIQNAEKYEYLEGLTSAKLSDQLYNSLITLPVISPETVAKLWGKLTEYMYIYSLNQLRRGRFIRWINLNCKSGRKEPAVFQDCPPRQSGLVKNKYELSYGGMVIDIEITTECPMILCKTPVGKMVKFDFNKNRVYQKLTTEEKMIIMLGNLQS